MGRTRLRISSGALAVSILLVGVAVPVLSQAWGTNQPSLSPDVYSSTDWKNWATTAWHYYKTGVGVSSTTGLHRATLTWHCFGDWDLGTYIYSIIYARRLGLITDGNGVNDWMFNERINKVLAFLQTRPLTSNGGVSNWPYLAYEWNTSPYAHCIDTGTAPTDTSDSGRLLAALYALKTYRPTYASTVDAIFNRSKSAYDHMAAAGIGGDYYGYLAAEGFAAFGYTTTSTFNAIDSYGGGYISNSLTYGQSLPEIKTGTEALDHVILEGDTLVHPASSKFLDFANRVYLTQSGRYSATSHYTGWTEGNTPQVAAYIYEWILINTGSWQQWIISNADGSTIYNYSPCAYVKVAFAYLAIYGENTYTLAMIGVAKNLLTTYNGQQAGFNECFNESTGASVFPSSFGSDKTNEFVLAAAHYVLGDQSITTTTSSSTSSTTSSTQTSTPNPVNDIGPSVINAPAGTVAFILPDYTGPYHSSASKCGGVKAAELSDYSAGGYILGLLANQQNEYLDTSSSISKNPCGSPTGIATTIVTLAGPGVNEVVHYYEQVAGISPVLFAYNGVNNFQVRGTGTLYSFNTVPRADYFLIDSFIDGSSRKVFTLYGFSWQGTLAAGVFFAAYINPQLAQFGNSWYIYEWQDASTGPSFNSIPDPGDTYTLIASDGAAPTLSSTASTGSASANSGFASIENDVLQASQNSVYFVLPDYTGPYHTPVGKCGGRNAASLSDYSAGGYALSAALNWQNEALDTGNFVSSSTCGQITGSSSIPVVTVAGPGVNTAIYYYEQVAATSPVYYHWDGVRNNFIVRATNATYRVSTGNTVSGDDLFLLESFTDSQGRQVYVIYGFSWQGTLAGATFMNTYVKTHLSEFQNNWYIYEWKDAPSGVSHNSFADPGDVYSQLATG
jgi:hypothetical protein